MNIDALLARLKNEASVILAEKRELTDGTTIYILETTISFFPNGQRHIWYTLVLDAGQRDVDSEEIEAILRRFWHAEIDIKAWLKTN